MTSLPTLKNQNLFGKTVLVRVDLNVPLHNGAVTDTTRFLAIKETVTYLLENQAKVLLLSHFGRPQADNDSSRWDLSHSLKNLAMPLEEILGCSVQFVNHFTGPAVNQALATLPPQTVLLLENIRFAPGEEANQPALAAQLAENADLYVNEAFSCSHRAHASIEAITHSLPSVAGFHFEKEVTYLEKCLSHPHHPLVAIIGGSKVSTKLELLTNLCQKVDTLIIGGAMANTFLAAQGIDIGDSLFEPNLLPIARDILETSQATIVLPEDVITAIDLNDTQGFVQPIHSVSAGCKIFDIGPHTIQKIISILGTAQTIVWNGPLGAFEYALFEQGTVAIAKALSDCTQQGILTVAGGGDTISALKMAGVTDRLSYVSTAGGAFLEWLEGKELPGIKALLKNTKNLEFSDYSL